MSFNYKKVLEKAKEYKPNISKFLRDMTTIPVIYLNNYLK